MVPSAPDWYHRGARGGTTMIVQQAVIDRIRERRANAMWLRREGPHPPVRVGSVYSLQDRPFTKGQVRITVTELGTAVLDALTDTDARSLGFVTVLGARAELGHEGECWTLRFVRGDHHEYMALDTPLFLHRNPAAGKDDYTTRPSRAALGEPEALQPALLGPYIEEARLNAAERE